MARGGSITVRGELFVSSHNNQVTATKIRGLTSGLVTISEADAAPSTFTFSANSRIRTGGDVSALDLAPYETFLAPFLTLSWRDPSQAGGVMTVRRQLGVYILLPPTKEAFADWSVGTFQCKDLCWLLDQDSFAGTYTVTAGTRYVDAVATILSNGGMSRTNIAYSSRTLSKTRSWDPGTSRLTIINDLLASLGYWPLWADWDGRLTSRKIDAANKLQPVVSFSTANGDILDSITFDPDLSLVANRVVVVGSSPTSNANAAPVKAVRNNTRADSPTSQVVLGIPGRGLILSRIIEDSRITTQSAADDLADAELAKATSVLVRMGLKLRPNPLIEFRQPVTLDIRQEDGTALADGKWRWDELQIGFTPSDGAMALRVNKLLPYGEAI
jgi:hypothetical protein